MSLGVYNQTYFNNHPEWQGNLYDCWRFEQKLHNQFQNDRHKTAHKFGGHTECFSMTSKILDAFPKKNDTYN